MTSFLGMGPGEVNPHFWLGEVGLALFAAGILIFFAVLTLLIMPD